MKLLAVFLGISLFSAGGACSAESHDSCSKHSLDTKVSGVFVSNQPLVPGVLDLGQISHVCFGLRMLDASAFTQVLHINVKDASVRQILDAMTSKLTDYEFRESSSGVTLVGKLSSIVPSPLLNQVVPTFETQRAPLNAISNALQMQFAVTVDPTITGFAGSYSSGDTTDQVGPFRESGKTVWELLNDIVGQSKGAMWITSVRESRRPDASIHPWKIIEYTMPPKQALELINEAAAQFEATQE